MGAEAKHDRSHVSRRDLMQAGLWSAPLIALAAAAPAAAASAPCADPATAAMTPTFAFDPATGGQSAVLPASDAAANTYNVTLASTVTPDTDILGYNYGTPHTFNFTQGAQGWAGLTNSIGDDFVISGAGPLDAIVLNQSALTNANDDGPETSQVDLQTIAFSFTKNGAPVVPQWVEVDIYGLSSSSAGPGYRGVYWDAIGFSTTPASIVAAPGTPSGSGAGSAGNPYGRATGDEPAQGATLPLDTFRIEGPLSGGALSMFFTQKAGRQGFHFASIAGIRFCA